MTILGLRRQNEVLRADLVRTSKEALDAELKLRKIRETLELGLPSEQTGPEWETCARVPVTRLAAIDAILGSAAGLGMLD